MAKHALVYKSTKAFVHGQVQELKCLAKGLPVWLQRISKFVDAVEVHGA